MRAILVIVFVWTVVFLALIYGLPALFFVIWDRKRRQNR